MKPPYITLLIAKSTGGIFHQAIMIYRTLRTKKLIPANRYFFEIRLNQFCRLRKVFNHILILPSFSKFFLVKKDTILREVTHYLSLMMEAITIIWSALRQAKLQNFIMMKQSYYRRRWLKNLIMKSSITISPYM